MIDQWLCYDYPFPTHGLCFHSHSVLPYLLSASPSCLATCSTSCQMLKVKAQSFSFTSLFLLGSMDVSLPAMQLSDSPLSSKAPGKMLFIEVIARALASESTGLESGLCHGLAVRLWLMVFNFPKPHFPHPSSGNTAVPMPQGFFLSEVK